MIKQKKQLYLHQILILVLLFLASMNVFEKYFYFIFLSFGVILVANRHIVVNGMTVSLISLSAICVLFFPDARSSLLVVLKQFAYPLCYVIGLNFARADDGTDLSVEEGERLMSFTISTVAMGSFGHFLLNMSFNMGSSVRNTIDIWSGSVLTATGQAALAILPLALLVVGMFTKTSIFMKLVSVVGCLLIFMYNLVLGGRMLLLLFLLLFAEAFIFTSLQTSKKNVWIRWIVLIIVLILLYCLINFNVFGIMEAIGGSNLSARFESVSFWEDGRISLKKEYVSLMIEHPFGGGKIKQTVGMYAHDIILDMYSDTGMIGCGLLVGILIVFVNQWLRIIRNVAFSAKFRLLLLCVYTAVFFLFFIEPIFAGMPWLFCSFCLFQGILFRVSRTSFVDKED